MDFGKEAALFLVIGAAFYAFSAWLVCFVLGWQPLTYLGRLLGL